jgi:DNA-binding CsgD family transcriptional regulator
MGKRGRPRHPDVLTPREWEVLELLRDQLSNEEIARRLGITERTAKFHVSEILGKLGLASREEAARWEPRARPWWAPAAAPLALLGRRVPGWLGAAAGACAAAGVVGGLAVLALLVLREGDAAISTAGAEQRLVFAAGGSIFAVAPDGSRLRELVIGERGSAWHAAPALSPDGETMLFTRDYDLWAAGGDGRGARLLADVAQLVTPPGASNPSLGAQSVAWSPDGSQVLYTLARIGGSGISDVWAMRPDGTERTQLHASGTFLLASWLDAGRVVAYEFGGILFFRTDGQDEPAIELPGVGDEPLLAVPARDGNWLVGPFIDEGPILYGPVGALEKIATGLSPALSPDGARVAYFFEETLRVAAVDGSEDAEILDLAPLGGRDRHFAEQPECFPDAHPACSYRPPLVSWWSPVKTYRDEALGIEFMYPASWTAGAPPMPYASCFECAVFGPIDAEFPYGVQVFVQDVDLDGPSCGGALGGCPATAFVGNRALPRGAQRQLEVAGGPAWQQEIERQAPLGLVNETGDDMPYVEVWTVLPLGDRALFAVAFWRSDDMAAAEETRVAYEALLRSLRID